VWRFRSARPWGPLAETAALEPTQARTAGSAAPRRDHRPLAAGDLAGPHKGAQAQGQTLLFLDAAGVYPLPRVVRTSAPLGHPPIRREGWTRDQLSALSTLSPAGKRSCHSQDWALDADDVGACLEPLLREVPGPLVMLWDGAPIPRRHRSTECLASGAAQRLHGERLPASAPARHPSEGLWVHLQGVDRRKVGGFTSRHLRHARHEAVKRVRRKPRLIQGCCRGANLEIVLLRSVTEQGR
jgi:hypothetical protein